MHGGRALHHALTDASLHTPLAQRAIDAELENWAHVLDGAEGRIAAVKAVAPLIATLPTAEVAGQVTRLAQKVNLDPATVTMALTEAVSQPEPAEHRQTNLRTGSARPLRAPPDSITRSLTSERTL